MHHKKFEHFLFQVTRNSCFNLTLIQFDCKLFYKSKMIYDCKITTDNLIHFFCTYI